MNGNEFPMSHGPSHTVNVQAETLQHQNKMMNGSDMQPTHFMNESDMRYSFNDPNAVSLLVPVFFAQRPEFTNVLSFPHQQYPEENYHTACASAHEMAKPPSFLEFMASDVTYPPHFSYHEPGLAACVAQNVPNVVPGLVECISNVPPTVASNTSAASPYSLHETHNFPPKPKRTENEVSCDVTSADREKVHSPQTYQTSLQIEGETLNLLYAIVFRLFWLFRNIHCILWAVQNDKHRI